MEKGAIAGPALAWTAEAFFLLATSVDLGNYKILLPKGTVSCETPPESENYGLDHFLC